MPSFKPLSICSALWESVPVVIILPPRSLYNFKISLEGEHDRLFVVTDSADEKEHRAAHGRAKAEESAVGR